MDALQHPLGHWEKESEYKGKASKGQGIPLGAEAAKAAALARSVPAKPRKVPQHPAVDEGVTGDLTKRGDHDIAGEPIAATSLPARL